MGPVLTRRTDVFEGVVFTKVATITMSYNISCWNSCSVHICCCIYCFTVIHWLFWNKNFWYVTRGVSSFMGGWGGWQWGGGGYILLQNLHRLFRSKTFDMSQRRIHHLLVGVVLGWRWGGLSDSQIMLSIRSIANIIPNKLEVTKVNIIALLLLIITVQF